MSSYIKSTLIGIALTLAVSQSATFGRDTTSQDWPMFRGPGGRSVGHAENLPREWSVPDGKNIAWQADLPGRGVSGPIVVDGKVFVTASSGPYRDRLHVIAFDASSGEQLAAVAPPVLGYGQVHLPQDIGQRRTHTSQRRRTNLCILLVERHHRFRPQRQFAVDTWARDRLSRSWQCPGDVQFARGCGGGRCGAERGPGELVCRRDGSPARNDSLGFGATEVFELVLSHCGLHGKRQGKRQGKHGR